MKQEAFQVNPSILLNVLTAILIFSLWPLLLGKVEGIGVVAGLPWMMTAFPILLIGVYFSFKVGDSVGAAVNAILTGVVMCQVMVKGLIVLLFAVTKSNIPEILSSSFDLMSGGALLAAAVFLASLVYVSFKSNRTLHAIWVCLPTLGFAFLGLDHFGISSILGIIGGALLVLFGFWLLYSGIAMSFQNAFGKKMLPY